jgi:murein DD-endopeptidase MepM/ murein hydrolase activator NlpD
MAGVLAVLLASTLLWAAGQTPAYAAVTSGSLQAELDDLDGQKSDIQNQLDLLQAKIEGLDYEKASLLEKKVILDEKNQLTQEELVVIQEQLEILEGLMESQQEELEQAREQEQYQKERWLTRVRAMEESSNLSYLEVLFDATSFTDFLTRLDLVNEIMDYDRDLEADYIAARENVEQLESETEAMYLQSEQTKAELEEKKAQLEADIESACRLLESIDENLDEYNTLLAQEQETQAEIEALIVSKEADLAAVRAAEAGTAAAATVYSDEGETSTWMIWPSYTTTLTSEYGYRTNPVSGVYKLHAGVDIGASSGTAIYAAADGTVVLAQDYGSYGNCVMINHGNGYTTLYAHMSSIAVSDGQTVTQGQTIGYVGATGDVTGPHLHFEVRASASGGTIDPETFSYR